MIKAGMRPDTLAARDAGQETRSRMRLNFWQWIGVALLILGTIVLFRNKIGTSTDDTVRTTQTS